MLSILNKKIHIKVKTLIFGIGLLGIAMVSSGYMLLYVFNSYGPHTGAPSTRGRNELHKAARMGNFNKVKRLYYSNILPGKPRSPKWILRLTDNQGYQPLHLAAAKGNSKIVEFLLQQGADINAKNKNGYTPLYMAARVSGTKSTIETLVKYGGDVNIANKDGLLPLHSAVFAARPVKVVEAFLSAQSKVNKQDIRGLTPLHYAAENGSNEIAQCLLSHGAKVNIPSKKGVLPLHLAACNGYSEVLETLLAAGSDVNAADHKGTIPLHLAAANGYEEIIPILLAAKTDIQATDEGGSNALHYAVQSGNESIAKLLIASGIAIDPKKKKGIYSYSTPLHIAAKWGYIGMCKLLLGHHADVNGGYEKPKKILGFLGTDDIRTPLYLAAEKGHTEIVKLLLAHGSIVRDKDREVARTEAIRELLS